MPRATFSSRYVQKKTPGRDSIRLLDLMYFWADFDHADFLANVQRGQFCVIDADRDEKAFFDWPEGTDIAAIERMIASHFEATPARIFEGVWLV